MRGTIWLVRHAPVDALGICYGQSDVPVLVAPAVAAERVLATLDERPARVVASPWARARDLGAAVAARVGVSLALDVRLSEMAFGAWEGRSFAALEREDAARFARWLDAWRTEAAPGGETIGELETRIAQWIASLGAGPTLAVTHAGPIRAIRKLLRPSTWEAVMRERVEHLAVESFQPDCP
jgi:alpha-ribazole phosphatase